MKLHARRCQSPISMAFASHKGGVTVAAARPATSETSRPARAIRHPGSWQATQHRLLSAGEEDKVPDIFACADPWRTAAVACSLGRAPGYRSRRCATRCMVRMGSACVRLLLCERRERVRTGCGPFWAGRDARAYSICECLNSEDGNLRFCHVWTYLHGRWWVDRVGCTGSCLRKEKAWDIWELRPLEEGPVPCLNDASSSVDANLSLW